MARYEIVRQTAYAAGKSPAAAYGVVEILFPASPVNAEHREYRVTAGLFDGLLAEQCAALGGKWSQDGWLNGWRWSEIELVHAEDETKAKNDLGRYYLKRIETPITVTFDQLDELVRKACLEMGPPCGDVDGWARRTFFVGEMTGRGIHGETVGPSPEIIDSTRRLFVA